MLTLLEVPATGGDTAWVSQVAAYERLSDPIKRLLEGLTAEHDGFRQAEAARRDGKFVRREPITSEHPIVRVHPVSTTLNIAEGSVDSYSRSLGKKRYMSILDSLAESLA